MDTIDKIKELIASLQAEIDEWETEGSLDDAREVPPPDKRSEEEKAEDTEREMNKSESEDKETAESPQEKAAEAAESCSLDLLMDWKRRPRVKTRKTRKKSRRSPKSPLWIAPKKTRWANSSAIPSK